MDEEEDMEQIIMNLHNKMTNLENKYIDLANFYKKEAVKHKQFQSLLSDRTSPYGPKNNTADNFYNNKSLSPIRNGTGPVEIDQNAEKSIINELL
jgi:hypothetical protein